MSATSVIPAFVRRHSFIELDARARAQSLMDPGSWRELVGPFDQIESPWLPMQGIAPQSDDGCVVLKGTIAGKPAVLIALEDDCGSRPGDSGFPKRQENGRSIVARNRRRTLAGSQPRTRGHR